MSWGKVFRRIFGPFLRMQSSEHGGRKRGGGGRNLSFISSVETPPNELSSSSSSAFAAALHKGGGGGKRSAFLPFLSLLPFPSYVSTKRRATAALSTSFFPPCWLNTSPYPCTAHVSPRENSRSRPPHPCKRCLDANRSSYDGGID